MQNYSMGNRIYEKRKEKNLSQKELGAMLGVSNKAVSKWETGAAVPKTETLVRLAEILDTTAEELLSGKTNDLDTLEKLSSKAESIIVKEELKKQNINSKEEKYKRAKIYLISVISLFFAVAILFVLLALVGNAVYGELSVTVDEETTLIDNILSSLGMAYVMCGVFTGFVWLARVLKKINRIWIIIPCCVLFPLTLLVLEVGGLIMVLPTIIISVGEIKEFKENSNG